MIRLILPLLVVTAAAPLGAAAPGPSRAMAPSLPQLFSSDDYPAEALRAGEQGTVAFQLEVGADGSVAACTVTSSSGSASLDSTTCRLLRERARFTPARDSSGKPVSDTVVSRITWRIPEGGGESVHLPPAAEAAMQLWSACTAGEAAKLVLSPLPAPQVAQRALAACGTLEALAIRELTKALEDSDPSKALPAFKDYVATNAAELVERSRAALKHGDAK
jgi:TonB family protein